MNTYTTPVLIPSVLCDSMNQVASYWSSVPHHHSFLELGCMPPSLAMPLIRTFYVHDISNGRPSNVYICCQLVAPLPLSPTNHATLFMSTSPRAGCTPLFLLYLGPYIILLPPCHPALLSRHFLAVCCHPIFDVT